MHLKLWSNIVSVYACWLRSLFLTSKWLFSSWHSLFFVVLNSFFTSHSAKKLRSPDMGQTIIFSCKTEIIINNSLATKRKMKSIGIAQMMFTLVSKTSFRALWHTFNIIFGRNHDNESILQQKIYKNYDGEKKRLSKEQPPPKYNFSICVLKM